jgi:hypothetical protein
MGGLAVGTLLHGINSERLADTLSCKFFYLVMPRNRGQCARAAFLDGVLSLIAHYEASVLAQNSFEFLTLHNANSTSSGNSRRVF